MQRPRNTFRKSLPTNSDTEISDILQDSLVSPPKQPRMVKIQPRLSELPVDNMSYHNEDYDESEIMTLEQNCAEKRTELEILNSTDAAAVVSEFESECIELYLEYYRLKKQQDQTLENSSKISGKMAKIRFEDVMQPFANTDKKLESLKDMCDRQEILISNLAAVSSPNDVEIATLYQDTLQGIDQTIEHEKKEIEELQAKLNKIRSIQDKLINQLTDLMIG